MNFKTTPVKDLFIIEPSVWKDERGYFFESYNQKVFQDAGIDVNFVQDNQSLSHKGALRGLHAQANPFAQGKLVRVIQGKVIDVVVDIRKDSPTYKHSFSIELSGENNKTLWIPPGFLHGFVTMEDNTIFTYKVTALYNKAAEFGVRWDDPDLNIDWGMDPNKVMLSEKDKSLPFFRDIQNPF
jgi:dTDP-4-dehydrorhamnose 3,5-epimerase